MTIPQSYQGLIEWNFMKFCDLKFPISDDAGVYECVAQNPLGADATRAELIIPGDKRGFRVY